MMKWIPFVVATSWLATTMANTEEGFSPVLTIHGSGTTNPSKCYWNIMDEIMNQAKIPTRLTYRAVGSSTGIDEFLGESVTANNVTTEFIPTNDFGSGDIPVSTAEWQSLQDAGVTMLHLPVVVGAISLFHSVPGVPQGKEGLNLTSCVIARIFKRDIVDWMHADITQLNPNLKKLVGKDTLPIQVARRNLGSSSTASFTEYLFQGCETEWSSDMVGKVVDWPTDTLVCEGSGGMTDCIRNNEGTIGYIDAGHGHGEGLVEIELRNANGRFLSSLEAAENGGIGSAAANANLPDDATGDFGSVELLNRPGDFTWPIVAMSYVYVRQDLTGHLAPLQQALLVAFLEALYIDEYIGGPCTTEFGFTAVPTPVRTLAQNGIASLVTSPGMQKFLFEDSTLKQVGQGDYVISSKRRSYAEYERTTVMSQVKNLQLHHNALEIELDTFMADISASKTEMAAVKSLVEQQASSMNGGGSGTGGTGGGTGNGGTSGAVAVTATWMLGMVGSIAMMMMMA